MLSADQALFYSAASSGHSIVLTGQGGTGKSYVIGKFADDMKKRGKVVSFTCSTGIAATHYRSAQTLHKWCGLGDGGINTKELVHLVCTDERYSKTRQDILRCDILIVDECSMISKKVFERVDLLCRSVRKNERYFGGIQVIFSGDFYQLPPVPDQLYGETGQYCFESEYFSSALPHHINLDTIFRQSDNDLISCVNCLENGNITPSTVNYIKSLERNIPVHENTMHLFSRHYKTNLFNHDKLKTFQGTLKVFESTDEGDSFYLQRFQAPKRLGLKVGCPVMLVVNLSESLVNGSTGKVQEFLEDKIIVHFQKQDITVSLSQYAFTKIDPVSRKTLAKRMQFPLILSFGITIHKSQGMSLESVVVDCENANIPGQLGVALGRAVNAEHLQVKNFSPHLVRKHPQEVNNFYNSQSKKLLPDCTCCRNEFMSAEIINDLFLPVDWDRTDVHFEAENIVDDDDGDDGDDDDDDAADFDDDSDSDSLLAMFLESYNDDDSTINERKVHTASPIPDYISPVQILNEIKEEYSGTPLEDPMNIVIEDVKKRISLFTLWLTSIVLHLHKICSDTFSDSELSQNKHVQSFCTKTNSYLTSESYSESCKTVMSEIKSYKSELGFSLFTAAAFKIQTILLKTQSEKVPTSKIQERNIPNQNFEEGKGNIRYIGGYCIAKLKFKYQKMVQTSLFNPSRDSVLKKSREKVDILSQVVSSYNNLYQTSSCPETLKSTARKQNLREGLTNITDPAFSFFQSLNLKLRHLETFSNLYKHGENTIEIIKSQILNERELMQQWSGLFDISAENSVSELFTEVVSKFINVSASHFRKDFLLFMKTEKSKAHRKKVMEKKENKTIKRLSFDEIISDKSQGKLVSHLKLKACVLTEADYFNDKFYTKKELQTLCSAYEIPTLSKHTKKYMNDQLITIIENCDTMLTPSVFDPEQNLEHEINAENKESPGTVENCEEVVIAHTTNVTKGKRKYKRPTPSRKGKGKKKRTEEKNHEDQDQACQLCYGKYDDSPDWIQCDSCNEWVHGQCVGITTSEQWKMYEDESVTFACPFCE